MNNAITVTRRPVDGRIAAEAQAEGYTPFQAALIAARLGASMRERAGSVTAAIAPTLRQLDSPHSLPDIDLAVDRIVQAIEGGETVICATDHDADGISAQSVLRLGLVDYLGVPAERVLSMTTDKLSEGYGISDAFVDRVIAHPVKATLLITADQGSCDEPRIARLLAAGIDTLVTDHHGLPTGGPPRSAVACVNPVRTDSTFPDPFIAGCHVAWLVIAAVRARMIERNHAVSERKLSELLELVTLGTISDCVSIANSINNRAIIRTGLRRMNGPNARVCWGAFNVCARRDPGAPIDESTVGYTYGPRSNASGRVSSAMPGVRLLLATDPNEARELAQELEDNNTKRRAIQASMVKDAEDLAEHAIAQNDPVLVLWLPDGHVGVQGIVAAHMVRKSGRPTICLASPPKAPAMLSGSMRSLPGVHAKQLLDLVAKSHPGILEKHGGHSGAAGMGLMAENFDAFRRAVHQAFIDMGAPAATGPVHLTDIDPPAIATLDVLEQIEALAPYGMDFPLPLFQGRFQLGARKPMGDGTHLRVSLHQGAARYDAVWFGVGERMHSLPREATVLYRLARNTWKGNTRVDIQIEDIMEDDKNGNTATH